MLETIVEALPAKLRLYSQLQGHVAAHAIVASNTSTIPIQRLAENVADASRFCGMHFLHPVRHRRLVEIVRGPRTSDETIAAATGHVRRIGRMPIVVRDGPGFLVNRLLFPYLGEALELLREGVPADAIERAATEFGMAIGPLRLMDEIGLDTTLQAGWVLAAAFPERIVSSPLLVSMVKAGRLGQKAGAGFYAYGKPAQPSPPTDGPDKNVDEIIGRWIDSPAKPSGEPIACRLVLPMLLEATRILEEGKVGDVRDIDLAVLFGLGFPADKGGLLWWADALGPRRILDMLSSLRTIEERNRPTPMLESAGEDRRSILPRSIAGNCRSFSKAGTFQRLKRFLGESLFQGRIQVLLGLGVVAGQCVSLGPVEEPHGRLLIGDRGVHVFDGFLGIVHGDVDGRARIEHRPEGPGEFRWLD